jgi:PAS domain S-box-containing protein
MLSATSDLKTQELELLAEVSKMLTSFDQERVLKNVIDLLMTAFGVEQSSLLINSETGNSNDWRFFALRPQFKTGLLRAPLTDESAQNAQRLVNDGLARWVVQHKQGTIIENTQADPRWIELPDLPSGAGSVLSVPFLHEDKVTGVFTLLHPEAGHFTPHHLQLMTIIANQVSVAMRNAQLFTRMQSQQRQLEAILHAMPDVLLVLDETGHVLLLNEAGAKLLQCPDDQVAIGRALRDFKTTDTALGMIVDIVSSPLQSGQNWSFEAHSEQQKREYLVNITVWEQQKGGVRSGFVVVMRDITQMRDLNRFKDEMLQMASHDLRSPLALIVGYCSLMQLDVAGDSKLAEYLGIVQQQTERMTGLLDELLRVEKIRSSPLELYERVNFRDLVNTALNNVRASADNKQHRLQAVLRLEGVKPILINPGLIREAMENFLTNAIKYTPKNGKITVNVYLERNRVYFVVEDNGIGIPADKLQRLFSTFFRVRQAGTEDIEGRGLGLSLVKTIIERHKGEVWVESTVGVGSRFGFWLPVD